MSELLEMRGRLSLATESERLLRTGIDTDIDELRMLANKFEEKDNLKNDRMLLVAQRLDTEIKKYREVKALICLLKKELGE